MWGRTEKEGAGRVKRSEEYALKNVDFSDPGVAQGPGTPNPPPLPVGESNADLKKPSIVFVRSAQSTTPALQSPPSEDNTLAELLPPGTRLVARLEGPVSSAAPAPVIAVLGDNYDHHRQV